MATDTTLTLTSSVNPAVAGQSITFTATVTSEDSEAGTPSGTVTFIANSNSIGTGTLNASGVATFTTATLAPPGYAVSASYAADGNFNSSTGVLTGNPLVVQRANTTVALTSSLNPANVSQSVTFTARVAPVAPGGGVPTGMVEFVNQGQPAGNVQLTAGEAVLTLPALTPGSHTVSANYDGSTIFFPSGAPLSGNPQVINKPTPTTLQPFNTVNLGAATPVWLAAPVSGNFTVQLLNLGPGSVTISQDVAFSSAFTLPPATPFALSIWGPTGFWVSASEAGPLSVALVPR